LNEPLSIADLECFDAYAHQSLVELQKLGKTLDENTFNSGIDETFQTILSNGKTVELCEYGKDK